MILCAQLGGERSRMAGGKAARNPAAVHNNHSRLFSNRGNAVTVYWPAATAAGRGRVGQLLLLLVNLLVDGRIDLAMGRVLLRDGLVRRTLCVTIRA